MPIKYVYFSYKILKTYCPNLTSSPPWPASMTMVYSGFGDAVALTVMQMPKHKQIKIKAINMAHNVRFFIVINLIFIKIYYYKSKKFITFWYKVLKFISSLV